MAISSLDVLDQAALFGVLVEQFLFFQLQLHEAGLQRVDYQGVVINGFALGDGAGDPVKLQAQLLEAVAGLDDLALGQVQGRAQRRILLEKQASLLLEESSGHFSF
jgi:hypothetical protein